MNRADKGPDGPSLAPDIGEAFQLVSPVAPNKKIVARKGRKVRFKAAVPPALGHNYFSRPDVPARSAVYTDEDFKVVREIVEAFCPVQPPRRLKRYLKGPFDLFEAMCIYVIVVELGWRRQQVARPIGRSRKSIDLQITIIEHARDHHAFIGKICDRAKEYCRGLNL